MLGTITKNDAKFDPLPENVYLSRLLGVKEKAATFKRPDGQVVNYTKLVWSFEILVEPFKRRRAWGKTPSNWISGKKLDEWLQAIGLNVASGTSIKLEDLKDIPVKIHVKEKKYKDEKTGEEKSFPEVVSLLVLDASELTTARALVAAAIAQASTVAPMVQAPIQASPLAAVQASAAAPVFQPVPTVLPPSVQSTPVVPSVPAVPNRTIPF